ncbi:hypothetical protein [Microtetraspora fusca]|uniref:DUF3618 domain-containing protein n=1 Tax=Microtetraspora fusca TaxID=1997 RepID=A0ABW6VAZ4_MICFU|nr:hypothetical protein [Microtetraspora fusca]
MSQPQDQMVPNPRRQALEQKLAEARTRIALEDEIRATPAEIRSPARRFM